jgi:hypothetical protein
MVENLVTYQVNQSTELDLDVRIENNLIVIQQGLLKLKIEKENAPKLERAIALMIKLKL